MKSAQLRPALMRSGCIVGFSSLHLFHASAPLLENGEMLLVCHVAPLRCRRLLACALLILYASLPQTKKRGLLARAVILPVTYHTNASAAGCRWVQRDLRPPRSRRHRVSVIWYE